MHNTVWGKLVQGILEAASSANFNVEALLAAIELDSSVLENADVRVPQEKLFALWQELINSSGEESIGLYLAEFARPANFDVIGYVYASSLNFGEGLSRLARYSRLFSEDRECTLETNEKLARYTYSVPSSYMAFPAYYQWNSANIILQGRRITGRNLIPQEVGFQCQQPSDLSAYRRLFRAPLKFEQPVN